MKVSHIWYEFLGELKKMCTRKKLKIYVIYYPKINGDLSRLFNAISFYSLLTGSFDIMVQDVGMIFLEKKQLTFQAFLSWEYL